MYEDATFYGFSHASFGETDCLLIVKGSDERILLFADQDDQFSDWRGFVEFLMDVSGMAQEISQFPRDCEKFETYGQISRFVCKIFIDRNPISEPEADTLKGGGKSSPSLKQSEIKQVTSDFSGYRELKPPVEKEYGAVPQKGKKSR